MKLKKTNNKNDSVSMDHIFEITIHHIKQCSTNRTYYKAYATNEINSDIMSLWIPFKYMISIPTT